MKYRWRMKTLARRDRVGQWQPTREAAMRAAMDAGVAQLNAGGTYVLNEMTTIESKDNVA
jgi:hypothetical protein